MDVQSPPERVNVVAAPRPARRRVLFSRLPEHWPLTVLLLGFPLWWALGLSSTMAVILAVPMILQLMSKRNVRMPAGFGAWIVFIVLVGLSVTMLFVDAPTAVPGGGFGRLMVFAYRILWYSTCGVVLLWVCNTDERSLSDRRVIRLLSWMFVVTTFGGLLGVLAPTFEFTSLVEMVLPGGITSNGFIKPLIHPAAASIQNMAGEEAARPIAPFEFANSWGANLSMLLPFFLVGWFGKDAGWRRGVAPFVLAIAAVPTVASLNRGLWASLAVGAVFFVVRLALRGKVVPLVGAVLIGALAAAMFLASPLADQSTSRLENPHSNDRRGQLLTQTVESMVQGSPVIGFGSTRDVQGSFASIAGGSTPDCKACAVPPLGTQGQIWLVLFSQGLVGAVAFLAFFVVQAGHHWRCRTTLETVGICLILFSIIQMFVYDTLGLPLYTLMIGIGLMWRERARDPLRSTDGTTVASMFTFLRRQRWVLVAGVVLGGLIGAVASTTLTASSTATVSVLLAPAPVYIETEGEREARSITVDTEAAMVYSERAIEQVRTTLGIDADRDLREEIRVTALPTTKVLQIHVSGTDPAESVRIADELAVAYLEVRRDYLDQRRAQVLNHLYGQLAAVEGLGALAEPLTDPDGEEDALDLPMPEEQVQEAIDTLLVTPSDPGSVIRTASSKPDRAQLEVPIMSGVVVGGLLALAAAALRDRRHRRQLELDALLTQGGVGSTREMGNTVGTTG